jgi:hypothetical protein
VKNRSVTLRKFQKLSGEKLITGVLEIHEKQKGTKETRMIGVFLPWHHFRQIRNLVSDTDRQNSIASGLIAQAKAALGMEK